LQPHDLRADGEAGVFAVNQALGQPDAKGHGSDHFAHGLSPGLVGMQPPAEVVGEVEVEVDGSGRARWRERSRVFSGNDSQHGATTVLKRRAARPKPLGVV
jgi:hypothetical protein